MRTIFTFILSFILFVSNTNAQVGISTTTPQAALDITSTDSGILIPRVALNSSADTGTVLNPDGSPLVEGTMVFNNGNGTLTEKGFYFWNGSDWDKLVDNTPHIHIGKFRITSTGTVNFTGLPFKPTRIVFTAYANVDTYDLNDDNSGGNNNNNTKENTFGSMKGYAINNGGTIMQQVIFNGGSGSSINDISRYASDSHSIGLRYTNNNGDNLGLTNATITSFNDDGFTLNITNAVDNVVVIYEAYRY
ncbi:hypothetical protein [Croceibacter atlanticus]|uniref:hypothetical protein n=1 Tax=Croceibacter atlanticus TaxID=313588 RepID=UPI0030F608C1